MQNAFADARSRVDVLLENYFQAKRNAAWCMDRIGQMQSDGSAYERYPFGVRIYTKAFNKLFDLKDYWRDKELFYFGNLVAQPSIAIGAHNSILRRVVDANGSVEFLNYDDFYRARCADSEGLDGVEIFPPLGL